MTTKSSNGKYLIFHLNVNRSTPALYDLMDTVLNV